MLFMTRHVLLLILLFNASCSFLKDSSQATNKKEEQQSVPPPASSDISLKGRAAPDSFEKVLREAIYFANSLEREALKLIQKTEAAQTLTLFSVLSYVAETKSGVKKSLPFGLDCGQYEIEKSANRLRVIKTCVRPPVAIAEVRTIRAEEEFQVEFFVTEWPAVLGLSVSLTGQNVICDLKVTQKKLSRMQCQNWSYQVAEEQTSATVVKAEQFVFSRESAEQFVIKGGFFKDLTENKKIDIRVPIEGKIKIIEKELEVIDEFLEQKEGRHEEGSKKDQKDSLEKIDTQGQPAEGQSGEESFVPDFTEPQDGEEVEPGQELQIPEPGEADAVPPQSEPPPSPRGGRGR